MIDLRVQALYTQSSLRLNSPRCAKKMIIYHESQSLSCHTHLKEFLLRMEGFHLDLTWMLSDIEAFSFPMTYQTKAPSIVSGRDLEKLSVDFPHCQIIWGVLSGFQIPPEKINLDECPVSEEPQIWEPDYQIQHSQAVCELVAWDSSATFFHSLDSDHMSRFINAFPESMSIATFQTKQELTKRLS